jgi:DNA invertase Pin-like site-specific DNA recombinase
LLRCAVYTRKSTDDGLEQDFNSLDAQREACEAFIRSQGGLGWKLLPARYDDGGVSGGTMDRPALQRLLEDIEQHQVDVVVVYKIDRLTRSLMDFSKIVEVFDKHQVSFVSVTQQFNTTTSMGRLTLNVLLSFAQFEREVTAERIRDKIAASKQKGMWMGGPVPLGYELGDRKLVVNQEEADRVRRLFELYLKLRSVNRLREEAQRLQIHPKYRKFRNGKISAPSSFTRGHLYRLLSNPLYIGEVEHKGRTFPGQHEPIIDREIWDKVQATILKNQQERSSPTNRPDQHLLTGLVFDETGEKLSPTHANKKGVRYRYYVSNRLNVAGTDDKSGWRLPAKALENAVVAGLSQFLRKSAEVIDLIQLSDASPDLLQWLDGEIGRVRNILTTAPPSDRRAIVQRFITRVDLAHGKLSLSLDLAELQQLLIEQRSDWMDIAKHIKGTSLGDRPLVVDSGVTAGSAELSEAQTLFGASEGRSSANGIALHHPANFYQLSLAFTLRQRGVETKLILNDVPDLDRKPDNGLILLIARAHRWLDLLIAGTYPSMEALARAEHTPASEISRVLPLAFLSANLIEQITNGQCATDLSLYRLKRLAELPRNWNEQLEQAITGGNRPAAS